MLPIQQYAYEVRVYYGEDEVASGNTTNAVASLSFKHQNSHTSIIFTISITVIDIYGQRSNSTVTKKTIEYDTSMVPSKHICMHA